MTPWTLVNAIAATLASGDAFATPFLAGTDSLSELEASRSALGAG